MSLNLSVPKRLQERKNRKSLDQLSPTAGEAQSRRAIVAKEMVFTTSAQTTTTNYNSPELITF